MKMKTKIMSLAVAASMLVACGGSADNTPEGVTKAFVKALASKDFDEAKGYCTKSSAAALDAMEGIAAMAPETTLEKEEVKCEVNGDKATCKFCCAQGKGEETYNLVKEDGNWKVEFVKGGEQPTTEPIMEEPVPSETDTTGADTTGM